MSGGSDVEIQAFELVLGEDLSGNIYVWQTDQFLFETLLIWLGADWAEERS